MKLKNLLILVIVAAVLGLLYAAKQRSPKERQGDDVMGKQLFPELDITAVERIEFQSASSTVTVQRVGSDWVSPARYNYPVKFGKVKEFLLGLADIKLGYDVQAGQDERARLKLIHPDKASAVDAGDAGTQLTLFGPGNVKLASLLAGKTHMKETSGQPASPFGGGSYPDGRYVEAPDGRIFVIGNPLSDLDEDIAQWMDKQLLNIARTEVVDITRGGPGAEPLHLSRGKGPDDYKLDGMAEGQEFETYKRDNLTGALSSLNFTDVADPALTADKTGLDAAVVFTVRTDSGKVITAYIGNELKKDEEPRYARFTAAFEAPPLPALDTTPASTNATEAAAIQKAREEELNKKREEQEKLATEMKELNAKLAPWTFVLAGYTLENMLTPHADLIKKPAPPATPPAAEAGVSNAVPAEAAPTATPAPETPPAGAADAATPAPAEAGK